MMRFLTTPLRCARKECKQTLQEVAAAVGCSNGFLSQVERQREQCSPGLAQRLVAHFNLPWLDEMHVLYPERFMHQGSRGEVEQANQNIEGKF